ncbi:MAG: TIGR01906 family membrane protein, partial [Lawsonibacter sp.]|nr:TIGR01906 family membrane protein [Lawsonibacter sp.]
DHFADVRTLFILDLWVVGLTLAALAAAGLYCRQSKVRPYCFLDHGPGFWAAVGLGTTFLVAGGLAALDFDRAFILFHALFFHGKDNWMFDWRQDPVILILPEEFFQNCAILILALLLLWCAVLILADLWAGKRRRNKKLLSDCGGCSSN